MTQGLRHVLEYCYGFETTQHINVSYAFFSLIHYLAGCFYFTFPRFSPKPVRDYNLNWHEVPFLFTTQNSRSADCQDQSGRVRPHNSTWTSADYCTVYSCSDGVINYEPVLCQFPPDHTAACVPVNVPGQCCPYYDCPDYGARGQ